MRSLVFPCTASPRFAAALALQIGDGIHPHQWLTANFVHVDAGHLLWDMLLLWTFGFVVEGKLGWRKSLAVYAGIGVTACALDQVIFLGAKQDACWGALGMVFGLMSMSVVWAPENSVLFVYAWWYIRRFGIRISVIVAVVFAVQLGIAIAMKSALSFALLHLIAVLLGFGIATWMLKTRQVDCENYDIFSVQAGRHKMSEAQLEAEDPEYLRRREEQRKGRRAELLEKIRTLVREGHPGVAWAAYQRMAKDQGEMLLPEADLCALIAAFHQKDLRGDSIPAMAEYLARFHAQALPMRIELAKVLVGEGRPMQALRVMAKINPATLSETGRKKLEMLRAEAERLHAEDPYEVADEDW